MSSVTDAAIKIEFRPLRVLLQATPRRLRLMVILKSSQPRIEASLTLISDQSKVIMDYVMPSMLSQLTRKEEMIEKGLILTGDARSC